MTNNINVTLETSVTPHELKVHDHGHVRIDKKPGAQLISWNLTGNLAQGSFLPICGNSPGFEWVSDPPPPGGIFGERRWQRRYLDLPPEGVPGWNRVLDQLERWRLRRPRQSDHHQRLSSPTDERHAFPPAPA